MRKKIYRISFLSLSLSYFFFLNHHFADAALTCGSSSSIKLALHSLEGTMRSHPDSSCHSTTTTLPTKTYSSHNDNQCYKQKYLE